MEYLASQVAQPSGSYTQLVIHTSEMQTLSHATVCSSHERVRHQLL